MKKITDKNNTILVLNAGSATLKWSLFKIDGLTEIGRGLIERIGEKNSFAEWRLHGKLVIKYLPFKNNSQAFSYVVKILSWHNLLGSVSHVANRIVHGGDYFNKAVVLTKENVKKINSFNDLAPLHNPIQLATAKIAQKLIPQAKHVAMFDTAWFTNLPEESSVYPISNKIASKYKIKRYGFHGISHAYVTNKAAEKLHKPIDQLNIISCHLGSGCSITAVRSGKPIDTSMGFTPLEGLVMGTRAGDIDPGIILHLLQQPGFNVKKVASLINSDFGLKGLSGVADMREVLVCAGYEVLGYKAQKKYNTDEQKKAQTALKVFLYRLQKYIGAYAAILGRVDAVIFTGGIGERNEIIRNLTMAGLPNQKSLPILVISTNEELAIAQNVINFK